MTGLANPVDVKLDLFKSYNHLLQHVVARINMCRVLGTFFGDAAMTKKLSALTVTCMVSVMQRSKSTPGKPIDVIGSSVQAIEWGPWFLAATTRKFVPEDLPGLEKTVMRLDRMSSSRAPNPFASVGQGLAGTISELFGSRAVVPATAPVTGGVATGGTGRGVQAQVRGGVRRGPSCPVCCRAGCNRVCDPHRDVHDLPGTDGVTLSNRNCHRCKTPGHIGINCPRSAREQAEAAAAQGAWKSTLGALPVPVRPAGRGRGTFAAALARSAGTLPLPAPPSAGVQLPFSPSPADAEPAWFRTAVARLEALHGVGVAGSPVVVPAPSAPGPPVATPPTAGVVPGDFVFNGVVYSPKV